MTTTSTCLILDPPTKLPREMNAFGDHLKPVSAAVMLSPPVRRSRIVDQEKEGASKCQ